MKAETTVYKIRDRKWRDYYEAPPHEAVRLAYDEHVKKYPHGQRGPESVEVTEGIEGYSCGDFFAPHDEDITKLSLKAGGF